MQGRLSLQSSDHIQSFPTNSWKDEFEKASKIGFEVIEWILDKYENPLFSNEGISEIKSLSDQYAVQINSVCADYFMENKLFSDSEQNICKHIEILKKLVLKSRKLGISMIELPLVDSSSLKTEKNKFELKKNIEKIIPFLEESDIFLLLETDLHPLKFKDLLLEINHPKVCANYDSGNSTSLNYDLKEEFSILKKWIKNVHVKDRKINGGTVPLGTGDTNFDLFFASLNKINYQGDLIIQGARNFEKKFSPEFTCNSYKLFVNGYLNKYYV